MDRSNPINRFIDALEKVTKREVLYLDFRAIVYIHDLIRDISDGAIGIEKYLVIYKGKILSIYVDINYLEIDPIKDSYILNRLRMKDNLRNYIWIGMK